RRQAGEMAARILEAEITRGVVRIADDLAGVVDAAHVGEAGAGIVDGGEHVVRVDGAGRGERKAGQQDPEAAHAASADGPGKTMHVELLFVPMDAERGVLSRKRKTAPESDRTTRHRGYATGARRAGALLRMTETTGRGPPRAVS